MKATRIVLPVLFVCLLIGFACIAGCITNAPENQTVPTSVPGAAILPEQFVPPTIEGFQTEMRGNGSIIQGDSGYLIWMMEGELPSNLPALGPGFFGLYIPGNESLFNNDHYKLDSMDILAFSISNESDAMNVYTLYARNASAIQIEGFDGAISQEDGLSRIIFRTDNVMVLTEARGSLQVPPDTPELNKSGIKNASIFGAERAIRYYQANKS